MILEVDDVSKRFGALAALTRVSFAVEPGQIFSVIGPNGAGKSTLFEIVSGNLPPSAGRISYFGTDCTAMPTHLRRRAGMCRTFQKVRLFESMSVAAATTTRGAMTPRAAARAPNSGPTRAGTQAPHAAARRRTRALAGIRVAAGMTTRAAAAAGTGTGSATATGAVASAAATPSR